MLSILFEYNFWEPDYFLHITNEKVISFMEGERIQGLSFLNLKEMVEISSVRYLFDEGKLSKLYDLVNKNATSIIRLQEEAVRINNLHAKLDIMRSELNDMDANYQGRLLTKSFHMMGKDLKEELVTARKNYNLFLVASISVPVLAFFVHFFIMNSITHNIIGGFDFNNFLSYTVPFLTLEIMLFYFGRVSYLEIKALNAQKLQVNHRLAVSRFIRSYVRQKTEFHQKHINDAYKDAINKSGELGRFIGYPDSFEGLMFSPIQTSGDNIPSALDGVNSIAEIAGKVMSAKK
ncbi:hypothetical protein [Dickeya fangzhongdai]|uniref:hypothetical protein n=1 Tax=Dickeya fangzhongdai TaxID=1778540 RepID=UPI0026DF60C7|nr:hypothetical protein [Dickeya fangzhongdai]WKV51170.1 hypothetical protein PL145_02550 [Dickeya fangzhongdai]